MGKGLKLPNVGAKKPGKLPPFRIRIPKPALPAEPALEQYAPGQMAQMPSDPFSPLGTEQVYNMGMAGGVPSHSIFDGNYMDGGLPSFNRTSLGMKTSKASVRLPTVRPGKALKLRQIQEENDLKEMLGDRYADYKAQMDALGPMKRRPGNIPGGGKAYMPGEQGWQEQEAQMAAIREQFGVGGGALKEFRHNKENKRIDDMMTQYGSFDNYEKQKRENERKQRIQGMIERGDVEGAMATENQFKEEDTRRETQRTQLEDFRKRYGIEAPAPVDDRERFRSYIGGKNQSFSVPGGRPSLGAGSFKGALRPVKMDMPVQNPRAGNSNQFSQLRNTIARPAQVGQPTQQAQQPAQQPAPQQQPPQMQPQAQANQQPQGETEEEKKRRLAQLNTNVM